jgi:protein arginine kinase activator
MGVTHSTTFSLADLLLNLEKDDSGEGHAAKTTKSKAKKKEGEACPACGFTLEDLKKLGKLGCPHCYEVFAEEMQEVLGEYQKNLQHRGKIPGYYAHVLVKSARTQELELALREAVAEEKFEEAAVIRDELRRMGEQA